MHKKMEKNVARKLAMDVLYSQGLNVIEVADVMRRLDKQKSIRLYTTGYVKNECFLCDHVSGGREVIDGCLVAVKDSEGKVVFGMSSIHPSDLEIAPSKQVTGIIAAVKAEMSPCAVIPKKFENEMLCERYTEASRFVTRCFKYFKVAEVSFTLYIAGNRESNLFVYKKGISGDIYLAQISDRKFADPDLELKKANKANISKKVNVLKKALVNGVCDAEAKAKIFSRCNRVAKSEVK